MAQAALISEDYRNMQHELRRNPQYGIASLAYALWMAKLPECDRPARLLD